VLQSTAMKGRNMDRVRVIRVLEYEGPRDWVEDCLSHRGVKGTKNLGNGCVIREAIVGDFPAVVEEIEKAIHEKTTVKERKFMRRFGWDLGVCPSIKRDIQTGKVLAHEGDETWDRDLKVAGE